MTTTEKRQFKRGPLLLPVLFTASGVMNEGYLTNLSAGGCLVYCFSEFPLEVDHPVEIDFNLKNLPGDFILKGQLVRVTPFTYKPYLEFKEEINYELGIKFLKADEGQIRSIEQYIHTVLENMKQE
jgi:hypothetical protein